MTNTKSLVNIMAEMGLRDSCMLSSCFQSRVIKFVFKKKIQLQFLYTM
jgi:hypothetical protein